MLTDKDAKEILDTWLEVKRSFIEANIHWKLLAIWTFFLGMAIGHYFSEWLWFLWI